MTIKNDYIIVWENSDGELAAEMVPNSSASDLEFIIENPLVTGPRSPRDTVTVYALGSQVWHGTGEPGVRI